jgi:hypothetical protein
VPCDGQYQFSCQQKLRPLFLAQAVKLCSEATVNLPNRHIVHNGIHDPLIITLLPTSRATQPKRIKLVMPDQLDLQSICAGQVTTVADSKLLLK